MLKYLYQVMFDIYLFNPLAQNFNRKYAEPKTKLKLSKKMFSANNKLCVLN